MSAEPMEAAVPSDPRGFISTFNPVLDREIKERMRAGRSAVLLSIFVAVMAGVLYLVYRVALSYFRQAGIFTGGGFTSAALGRIMFEWTILFLLMLVAFISPGLAAASIAGEKERRTLHLLQITLLPPRSIALGKLAASAAFLLLMLVAVIPLLMVPIVLGGVTAWQVIKSLIVITSIAVFIVALSTYFSSVAKRSQSSTVLSYLMTFLFGVGAMAILLVESFAGAFGPESEDRPVSSFINPLVALADAATDIRSAPPSGPSILSQLAVLADPPGGEEMRVIRQVNGEVVVDDEVGGDPQDLLPVWPVFVGLMVLGTIIFIFLTTLRLRLPSPRFVLGKMPE